MKPPINSMTVKFDSRSVNEGFARAAAAAFIAQMDPTLEELNDMKTAVSEAVTNCIVHAYPENVGEITLSVKVFQPNTVEIVIRDKGCGIADVEKARTPMFTTGGSERSGMGFTIMESFTDKLKVRSVSGRGTTVTMLRSIKPRVGRR